MSRRCCALPTRRSHPRVDVGFYVLALAPTITRSRECALLRACASADAQLSVTLSHFPQIPSTVSPIARRRQGRGAPCVRTQQQYAHLVEREDVRLTAGAAPNWLERGVVLADRQHELLAHLAQGKVGLRGVRVKRHFPLHLVHGCCRCLGLVRVCSGKRVGGG
eukprot:1126766-Pleurochrysis_carterae.AAC.3